MNGPERELNADVLRQWSDVFGTAAKLTREVVDEAQKEDRIALKQALLAVAAERDHPKEIDPRRFGRWCANIEGRIIDGLRLSRGREIKRAQEWRVSLVSSVSSTAAVPNASGEGDDPAEDPTLHLHDFDQPSTDSPNSPNSPDGIEL